MRPGLRQCPTVSTLWGFVMLGLGGLVGSRRLVRPVVRPVRDFDRIQGIKKSLELAPGLKF